MKTKVIDFHNVYFLGIGGIGMSALARYFLLHKKNVAGYDRIASPLTLELIREGCEIDYLDDPALIPKPFLSKKEALIVYTPAIKSDNSLLSYFRENGFTIMKRAEVLGLISQTSDCLCVAGTHGKSTTSSLLAYILSCSTTKLTAFLGAIATNFNSNLVLQNDAEFIVVEADEFDRSFLQLTPFAAIITSCDPDHLDIYGSKESFIAGFQEFAMKINVNGLLVIKEGIVLPTMAKKITYALFSDTADYAITNLYYENDVAFCDVRLKKTNWTKVELGLPGIHNAENALACIALLTELGIPHHFIIEGLKTFLGLKRRFETIIKTEKIIFIDDYAHHPTEIDALITSIRMRYPNKKITGLFQPHLYSRTNDFAHEFAESLSALDEVILLPIYAARELPMHGVTSEYVLNLMNHNNKKLMSNEEVLEHLKGFNDGVFVTIGAGDIDRLVAPIHDLLLTNLKQL